MNIFQRKWKFNGFSLLMIAALLLTACGGGGNNNGDSEGGPPTEIPTPEATFTVGVEKEADEPTETPQAESPEEEGTPPADTPSVPETGALPVIPPEIEQYAAEWPMGNRDYGNTRAVLDAGINSSNADQLGLAWTFDIPGIGSYGGAASTPLIANGIVYFQDLASNIFAIDLQSGELVWEHRMAQNALGPNGVALGYGKLFAQGGESQVVALDLETGEEIWVATLEGPSGSQQPYVYDGMVFTAIAAGAVIEGTPGQQAARRGYAAGHSGVAYALDQETGEMVWRFQVVEDDFWGHPEINGGGGIWYPPAIDTERGLTYWGTGNPSPFPGIVGYPNGTSRPGPNLYTNSILALDHQSGELAWYHQAKPHDLFDLDYQISPVLATTDDGTEIVIGSGKLGRVFAYERQSGELLWETLVGEHQNDDLDEVPEGEEILVLPGVWGGVETPMAYAEGVLYMSVLNLGTPYTADGFGAENGTEAVSNASGRTELPDATGEIVAINVTSGDILWTAEFDEPAFGGATVVNDLVFTSTFEGALRAYAREDGREVWSFQSPGGIIAWPAVAGDTIVYPIGIGSQPVLAAFRVGAGEEFPQPRPTLPPSP